MQPTLAVVIPCYNEQTTIGTVVDDFRRAVPEADIYVFDNMSTDDTAEVARRHGAILRSVRVRGKGQVVTEIMRLVPADVQLMVDGDDTYPAEYARQVLQPVLDGQADMVIAARLHHHTDKAFRPFHVFGNVLIRELINLLCGARLTDALSGYRAYTAELARSLRLRAVGFEIETELDVKALDAGFVLRQVQVPYRERPAGSISKLRTLRDGARALWTIARLAPSVRPGGLLALLALAPAIAGLAYAVPGAMRLARTGAGRDAASVAVGAALLAAAGVLLAIGAILGAKKHRARRQRSQGRAGAPQA